MANLKCICGHHMNNNMDIVYFSYDCFSDALFNEKVAEVNNGLDEYFYYPDEIPEIWRCPKCKTIYLFEFQNNIGEVFLLKDTIPMKNFDGLYECTCGHHFNQSELIHCYSDEQRIEIVNKIYDSIEKSIQSEFEDSRVHIWKCPDCNRLYWIERDSGIVQCYEKKE